jgi:hypothetical protein
VEPEAASPTRQAFAVVCSLGAAAFSVIPFLIAFFWGVAGQCDESCDPGSSDWRRVAGAWQWHVLPVLGGAVFLAGICLAVFVIRRRPSAAGVSFGAGLLSLGLLALWSGVGLHTDFVRLGMHRFLLLVGPIFLGAVAVFMTESRNKDKR